MCIGVIVFLSAASQARAELAVDPRTASSNYERNLLRDPGTMDSRSSEFLFFEPNYGASNGWGFASGDTHDRSSGASMDTGFFKNDQGVVENAIRGDGSAQSLVRLENDEGLFTTASASTRTQMTWIVTDPVTLRLTGSLDISDTLLMGDISGSAGAGIQILGNGISESRTISGVSDQNASFDWTLELQSGFYRVNSWAYSFSFSSAANAEVGSEASYSFQGVFTPVPAPYAMMPLLSLVAWRRKRSSH